MVKFRILSKNDNCVLLQNITDGRYKVRDIENDDIYIGSDFEHAKELFESYDINKVRKERKDMFEQWLKEFAQA